MFLKMRMKERYNQTLEENETPRFEFTDVRELNMNFEKNVMRFRYRDTTGEHNGEHEISQIDDMDWSEDPTELSDI